MLLGFLADLLYIPGSTSAPLCARGSRSPTSRVIPAVFSSRIVLARRKSRAQFRMLFEGTCTRCSLPPEGGFVFDGQWVGRRRCSCAVPRVHGIELMLRRDIAHFAEGSPGDGRAYGEIFERTGVRAAAAVSDRLFFGPPKLASETALFGWDTLGL